MFIFGILNFALSLYTCTTGGTSRLVVRCMSIDG